MTPDPDDLDRHDIVRRLFVQITAALEDGTEIAVAGQGADGTSVEQADHADNLRAVAHKIALLADAIVLITSKLP